MPRLLVARDETVVVVTSEGQIAIHQDAEGERQSVFLDPADVPRVVEWLREAAADACGIQEMKNTETIKRA
jgi:hypothetical protein